MEIVTEIAAYPALKKIALTVGNFDGVHLGHQFLLKKLVKIAHAVHHPSAVITFKNHPLEILNPSSFVPLLCTFDHKVKLIADQGIDILIPITFSKEYSLQTAEEFLQKIPSFSNLLLGPDATIGKDKQGNRQHLQKIASDWGFNLEYMEELTENGVKISSRTIRELIQKGNLNQAEKLLGRKFSIYKQPGKGLGLGKRIGFPTLNMDVEKLCIPPLGVYAVKIKYERKILNGVANLGVAPTVRKDNKPILEVHLLDAVEKLTSDSFIEVIFYHYIRPELRFETLDALKEQIGKDVQISRQILKNGSFG